jgi:hypothetical protein
MKYTKLHIWYIILALFGCKKIDTNGYQIFTIKRGKHRSGYRYKSNCNNHIEFKVKFDESAIYKTLDPANQADVNKLYGVSDCGKNHMDYSIRFGWRYYQDKLQILWFKHEAGKFSFDVITNIEINKVYNCTIDIFSDEYIISVSGLTTIVPRSCIKTNNRYYLYPYFGGDETAPHDINIKIKSI